MKNINQQATYLMILLISLLPFFLLTGPFLPNFVVSICCFFLFYYLKIKSSFSFLYSKFFIFYFVFLLLLILSSFLSANIEHSLEHSLFYFRFILFSILLSLLIGSNSKITDYIFYILISIFLFLIIDGFLQYFFEFNIFMQPMTDRRISSIFGDEFILGSYLSRFLPILMALLTLNLKIKNFSLNNSYFILFILFTSNFIICLSGERTAVVFMILFNLLFLLLSTKVSLKKIIIPHLIISVLIISALLITDNTVKERLVNKTK